MTINNNIKLLHLSSERTWRGGEQQIAYLLEELNAMGVQNIVVARNNSAFEEHCKLKQIKVYRASFTTSFNLKTALLIKALCEKERIDLIHAHSSKSHSLAVLSSVLGNAIPIVLSRRVDFVPSQSWLTKWKYNQKSIKKIVGVSDKITTIMKAYVKNPSLCTTIHSGVNVRKFNENLRVNILRKEFAINDQTFLIGNTSALEEHKDYYTFIDTIEKLIHGGLPVMGFIIGDGSLKDELIKTVNRKQLQHAVIFIGFRNDIKKVLSSLDIFLMTSNKEGLGTSILDAFLAQVPVVATNAGGIPEMVIHEQTGMLAPIADADKLSEYVTKVLQDADLKKKITSGASSKVQEFSTEHTAQKTLKVYKEVLGIL